MTTLDIKLNISDEVLAFLKQEAERRDVPLDVVVSESLEAYFDDAADEEILASLKTGMQQALTGNYRLAHDVLDEIEHELIDDANNSFRQHKKMSFND